MCCLKSVSRKAYTTYGNPPHSPPRYALTICSPISVEAASKNIVSRLRWVSAIEMRAANCSQKWTQLSLMTHQDQFCHIGHNVGQLALTTRSQRAVKNVRLTSKRRWPCCCLLSATCLQSKNRWRWGYCRELCCQKRHIGRDSRI